MRREFNSILLARSQKSWACVKYAKTIDAVNAKRGENDLTGRAEFVVEFDEKIIIKYFSLEIVNFTIRAIL